MTKALNESPLFINASTVIRSNNLFYNGEVLLNQPGLGLSDFLNAGYEKLAANYGKFFKMDKLSKLGWLGTEYLLRDFDTSSYSPEKVGIVLSNANASLDADLQYMESVQRIPSPALFVYTLPNIVIGEISIRHGFKGENAFFISRIFDAALIDFYVSDLLHHRGLEACVCGWVDVLEENYDAALWLVSKEQSGLQVPFTKENLRQSYQNNNGSFNA